MKIKIRKTVDITLVVIAIVLLLWVGLSFIEVWSKNMSESPNYSELNFFNYMTLGGM